MPEWIVWAYLVGVLITTVLFSLVSQDKEDSEGISLLAGFFWIPIVAFCLGAIFYSIGAEIVKVAWLGIRYLGMTSNEKQLFLTKARMRAAIEKHKELIKEVDVAIELARLQKQLVEEEIARGEEIARREKDLRRIEEETGEMLQPKPKRLAEGEGVVVVQR